MGLVTTSAKLEIVLELADGPSTAPASTLRAIAVSLKTLIPEVEELERRLAEIQPQDAAPSAMDDLREQGRLVKEQLASDLTAVRSGLARKLRDAAAAIHPGE